MRASQFTKIIAALLMTNLILFISTGLFGTASGYSTPHDLPLPSPDMLRLEALDQVSPDGEQIAYVVADDLGMNNSAILYSRLDGSDSQIIARGDAGSWVTNPLWSPDGKNIAYLKIISYQVTEFEIGSKFELWVFSLETKENRLLTNADTLNPSISFNGVSDIKWKSVLEIEYPDNRAYPVQYFTINISTLKTVTPGKQLTSQSQSVLPPAQPGPVPYYKQCDSRWGTEKLGTCTYTICEQGCAMSSTAMVFTYFGVTTNPGLLNTWLINNSGYAGGCLINWTKAANLAPDKLTFIAWITNTDSDNGAAEARLRAELDSGYPVILEVPVSSGQHFVTATGYSGDTVFINDPAYTSRTTLDSYGNQFKGLRIYHGPTGNPPVCPVSTETTTYVCNPTLTPVYKEDTCSSLWYPVLGFGGNKSFLVENAADLTTTTNSGSWVPTLPVSGKYKVEAFIARHGSFSKTCGENILTFGADSSKANYLVTGKGGTPTEVIRDQLPLNDEWLNLGIYDFEDGNSGKVTLSDLTGEAESATNVSFGAMRFTLMDPLLTSTSPPVSLTGQPDLALTLTGANFNPTSLVNWNGLALPTTFVNATSLTTIVPAIELASPREVDITVIDSALNGVSSLPLKFQTHTFEDTLPADWYWKWVEGFYAKGITTGCTMEPLNYCPDRPVTRAEMAVFLLRAQHVDEPEYAPDPDPLLAGVFTDIPVVGKEWMQPWIEEFYEQGITKGCLSSPLRYCPDREVTRAEMAVFVLRALHGKDYLPPAAENTFSDLPVAEKEWMQPWIEQFYREGITSGCSTSPLMYCPEQPVTRAEMAVFIDRAFGFPQLP